MKNNQELYSNKVTTLPKVSSKSVLEFLNKNIEFSSKNKVTTLESLIISEKEPLAEALSENGASSGTELQPLFKIIALELECTLALIREYL